MKPYYQTKLGKLYNCDCTELMKTIKDNSIDLVLTDPPYNIGQVNKRTKQGNKIVSNKDAWGEWDDIDNKEFDTFMFKLLKEWYRMLVLGGSLYCFTAREKNGFYCDYAQYQVGFTYNNTLSIIKDNPLPRFTKTNWRSAFELAFYMSKSKPKTFNFISQQKLINKIHYVIGKKDTIHPTEKPLKAIKLFIEVSSKVNDIVLDPFLGSGTTAIACEKLGRRWIGIEISEKYCAIAAKRIDQEIKSGKVSYYTGLNNFIQ